jgi:CRP/FNR family transcriptional regulator, cyclic AMP receptor protein
MSQARDNRVEHAIERSFLGGLPQELTARLLADAILIDVPAGGIIYRSEDAPRSGIVIAGLVRVFLTSIEGRQLTVRYARSASSLGAPTAIAGPVDVGAQAVVDSAVLMFSAAVLRAIASEDARVAWPLAQEVTSLLYGVLDAFAGSAFGSVRQRVARHLLDLATARQRDSLLVVEVSQQDLADAVGSAREVVARTLAELRSAGLIRTGRKGIVLVDADGIELVASSDQV